MSAICRAAAWSKYHIAVTQRKEEEGTSSKDYYDAHSPGVSHSLPHALIHASPIFIT